jgi:hypothetical protein
VRAAISAMTRSRKPTSLMCRVMGRPQQAPAFQPYCACGIGHQVAVLISVGVHVRLDLLQLGVLRGAVQVEDQGERLALCRGRRHVKTVVTGQTVVVEGEDVGAAHRGQPDVCGGRRRSAGRGQAPEDGHQGGDQGDGDRSAPPAGGLPVCRVHGGCSVSAARGDRRTVCQQAALRTGPARGASGNGLPGCFDHGRWARWLS